MNRGKTMNRQFLILPPPPPPPLCPRNRWIISSILCLLAVCIASAQAQAQNNPATGQPAVTYVGNINAPTEDSAITATEGAIADQDNTPPASIKRITWIWSQADTHGSTYSVVHLARTFTPLQVHVGKFLQVCAAFADDANNAEQRCLRIATAVAPAADRPVALNHTIRIPAGTTRYRFKAADFPFIDEDDDAFADSIYIESLPANGTLEYSATVLDDTLLTLARHSNNGLGVHVDTDSFPSFVYNLPDTAAPNPNYASFRYRVITGPLAHSQYSANIATITFAIAPPAMRLRLRLFLEGPLR